MSDEVFVPAEIEMLARWLAERINGGSFYDPRWYTEEQRELWRGHARALVTFMGASA